MDLELGGYRKKKKHTTPFCLYVGLHGAYNKVRQKNGQTDRPDQNAQLKGALWKTASYNYQ